MNNELKKHSIQLSTAMTADKPYVGLRVKKRERLTNPTKFVAVYDLCVCAQCKIYFPIKYDSLRALDSVMI